MFLKDSTCLEIYQDQACENSSFLLEARNPRLSLLLAHLVTETSSLQADFPRVCCTHHVPDHNVDLHWHGPTRRESPSLPRFS